MRMTVLSHAGLLVEHEGRQLICDPWLVGSAYWRSWWNYPPVSPGLIAILKPDWIYLSHIHWDHFHGASLRLFSQETPVFIPYDRYTRMRDDLHHVGFKNVIELRHGRRRELDTGIAITSYQFSPFTDSAVTIEAGGTTILNANDAKIMGGPLDQILRRHPMIDFALRSHSSANARSTFHCLDAPDKHVDDADAYHRTFCAFMHRVQPRYAVPFASNHCHLHRDTIGFNASIVTPSAVARAFDIFRRDHPMDTELKVMTSGDSWDAGTGFDITPSVWLEDRDNQLAAYAESKRATLERTYEREARARIREAVACRHLMDIVDAVPFIFRVRFRGRPVLFDVRAGSTRHGFLVDLWARQVTVVDPASADPMMMRVIIPTSIFVPALLSKMFGHAAISKRLQWQATKADMKRLELFSGLLSWHEAEAIPFRKLLNRRFFVCYMDRWRELLLYARMAFGVLRGRGLRAQEMQLLSRPPNIAARPIRVTAGSREEQRVG
jgi:UDP-MurNAc hydroxylase